MKTNDESVWLFKINPKVLEVLNQLLKAMEQLSMAPPKVLFIGRPRQRR